MAHHTTLVQRCRRTNSLLADELSEEFSRLEREIESLKGDVQNAFDMGYRAAGGTVTPVLIPELVK